MKRTSRTNSTMSAMRWYVLVNGSMKSSQSIASLWVQCMSGQFVFHILSIPPPIDRPRVPVDENVNVRSVARKPPMSDKRSFIDRLLFHSEKVASVVSLISRRVSFQKPRMRDKTECCARDQTECSVRWHKRFKTISTMPGINHFLAL